MRPKLLALPLLATLSMASGPTLAQLPRTPVTAAPQSGAANEPSFRDPKTGQVWTPENVGEGAHPVPPAGPQDRAFNPNAQSVPNQRVYQQQARMRLLGTVPITAGPTVPLVNIDNVSLRVRPGARWSVVLYLQNNSASTLAPSLDCRFTNSGRLVLDSYVSVPPVAGGQRVGLSFAGPPSELYVDNVSCQVVSP